MLTETAHPGPAAHLPVAQDVVAAKLQMLRLEPIKARMGDRWARLSVLVHKLFERALRQMQGPDDHFLQLDEMSYVVSFHRLSVEEASLACAAISKEVCELLFGADIEDGSVRSLVGAVSPALFARGALAGTKVSALLERTGSETITSHPRAAQKSATARTTWAPGEWVAQAQDMTRRAGWGLGFFPVWDLARRKSFSFCASLRSTAGQRNLAGARRALSALDEAAIVETEITMLFAAAEYALRLQAAGRVCVLSVGVSYETLSGLNSRIRYLTALKAIRTAPECPLMVRLGPIPDGTPLGRIAEIVAMMAPFRVLLEFKALRTLPEMDIRLGAAGIGGVLPADCDPDAAAVIAQRLVRRGAEQKWFTFLDGLDDPALLKIARDHGIRAGSGQAIGGGQVYAGQEPVPEFPLLADNVWQV